MPPADGSSIGARLGAFLSSLTASPPTPRLVSPTREMINGLLQLSGPWIRLLARLIKVGAGQRFAEFAGVDMYGGVMSHPLQLRQ